MPTPLTRWPWRRLARWGGTALTLAALALLLQRGISLGSTLGPQLRQIAPTAFAAALGLYLGGGLLLGATWVLLVRLGADGRPHPLPLLVGHLRAQIAKYLPGNVFHYAWRHVAAHREGVGHRALALALALESLLLAAAAAMFALGVATDPRVAALAPWAPRLAWVLPLLPVLAWLAIGVVARRLGLDRFAPARTAGGLSAVLVLDLTFFLLAALALRLLASEPAALPLLAWCGWLALAWMVGYVTPGAPAGLGLREAVLVLGLGPVFGEAEALALALAYRLVTLVADAALAAIGFLLPQNPSPGQPADGA